MLPSIVRRLSGCSWRSSQLMARVLRVSVLELLRCRLRRIVDPVLTEEGKAQVSRARAVLAPSVAEFELVIVSPLTRAVETALGIFSGSGVPMLVTPLLRERLGTRCDEGRTKAELLNDFPCMASWEGTDELRELWWSHQTEWDLFTRVDALRELIDARPERTIAVVGHGRIFSLLLGIGQLRNADHKWISCGTPSGHGHRRVTPHPSPTLLAEANASTSATY